MIFREGYEPSYYFQIVTGTVELFNIHEKRKRIHSQHFK
ncbi:hypothetical protein [Chryseobacterium proteolyticum]